jgi:CO/xanthine dehydrogenase Mo-binding subunit
MNASLSRRDALRLTGGLVVMVAAAPAEAGDDGRGTLSPAELDSWIAIGADGEATAFFGKVDVGQGLDTAVAQMVAEELDLPMAKVAVVMGDTARTCNQGGASGSTGVQRGGVALRAAAAEARRLLVERAAAQLRVPADRLETVAGTVRVVGAPDRRVGYGVLVGGRPFRARIAWNGQWGNPLALAGAAPKSPDRYSVVGTPVPRRDIPGKVTGAAHFVTDVRLPGMLHGRMIRPPVAGAVPVAVDEASIAAIPGARVVRRGDVLGVVAPREWDAVRAADALRIAWSEMPPPFPDQARLYDHIRATAPDQTKIDVAVGDVDGALATAARRLAAEYEWPFQSHASMGPACAVADVRPDGVTCWSATQKPHFLREGLAALLQRPAESVRVIWTPGPGSYGRNDAGDAAADAAVLSAAVGKPVRVQGMRHDGHGWDPKGPASIHRLRAGLDAAGTVIAYDVMNKGFSRMEVSPVESEPGDTLAGILLRLPRQQRAVFGTPADVYRFRNRRLGWQTIPPLLPGGASPLRTTHLRDPVGPQNLFAAESFIDEIAFALAADPVAFRLRYLQDPREAAVVKAAAARAGWRDGPAGARRGGTGIVATGQGIAFARRGDTVVATVAEVEVDRANGRIRARRVFVAHDCGLVINPSGLRLCIEGNVLQGLSRALSEEVLFDRAGVVSRDWGTYMILDIADAPDSIDVEIIDRPELPPQGAGEACIGTIAAAVANALFDATGLRLRRAPLTPERVLAASRGRTA